MFNSLQLCANILKKTVKRRNKKNEETTQLIRKKYDTNIVFVETSYFCIKIELYESIEYKYPNIEILI